MQVPRQNALGLVSPNKTSSKSDALNVALGEYDTGWHDPALSLKRAGDLAGDASKAGADLLVLPEMCITGFTMEAASFAEPEDGESIKALGKIAADNRLWIIGGASIRKADGRYVNSALVFSPDGELVTSYEKQRLFGYAGETDVYSAGEPHCVVDIGGVVPGAFFFFHFCFSPPFPVAGCVP